MASSRAAGSCGSAFAMESPGTFLDFVSFGRIGRTRENLAAASQSLLPVTVGEQAVVANPHEAVWKDVQEEATCDS